jgi:hypothetical protein
MEQNIDNKPTAVNRKSVVVNAAKLDSKTPIPLETNGNGFQIKKGRQYVPFFDNGDNFFNTLLEAGLLSPTNFACVNSKTKYSIGRGLMIKDKAEHKEFKVWARSVNKKGESLNEIIKQIFNNYYSSGNCFIELVRLSVGKSKYLKIFVRNYIDCRLNMPDDDDDYPDTVLISKLFRKKGVWTMGNKDDVIELPIYNGDPLQKWAKLDDKTERIVIHIKHKISGYDYYGLPSNVACLPQQILEYKGARFNLDMFDNNLVIGGVIMLQGNMTDDESKKLSREITVGHSGDGNRGKFVILSSEDGIENSKIIPFDQNKDFNYVAGDKRIEEKIFMSNEWSKILIDPTASGLGSSGKQIREIYETKMNTVIGPEQSYILEKFLQPAMLEAGKWLGNDFGELEFMIDNIPALGIANDIDINAVLTKDEGRDALGYEPTGDETGKQTIKSSTQLNLFSDAQNK